MTVKKNDASLPARERQAWHAVKTISEEAFSVVIREMELVVGISSSDFAVLSRLEELRNGKVSQKKLTEALSWDKGRLSHQLTRIETRDLLTRKLPHRRAGVELEILPEGRNAIAAARQLHARAIGAHILELVSPEHSDALIALAIQYVRPAILHISQHADPTLQPSPATD